MEFGDSPGLVMGQMEDGGNEISSINFNRKLNCPRELISYHFLLQGWNIFLTVEVKLRSILVGAVLEEFQILFMFNT